MNLPNWTREPLVHFLVLGTVIFAFFTWRGEEADPASRSIEIDREVQAQIAIGFERLMGRAPTDAELDAQIDRYVREEVLYREALRLGLDRDDAVVRRRLAQKMDLLAGAQAEIAQPSEDALQKWYADHPERFADEARYTLDQLWFSTDIAARSQMERLQRGAEWQALGEVISLPKTIEDEPRRELANQFGEQFPVEIDRLESGDQWHGPIPSGLGWHLVRLREVQLGELPPLDQIRDDVENDWRSATITQRRDDAYQLLRDSYLVDVTR